MRHHKQPQNKPQNNLFNDMAIYSVCKKLLTTESTRTLTGAFVAVTVAGTVLLSAGCSHEGHQMSDTDAEATTAIASTESGSAQATSATDGSKDGSNGHSETDEMSHGAAHGHSEHAGDQAKGVKTNHDVFHSKAIEVPAGTAVPAVTVRVEEDEVRGWNLYVGTANFTFEPTKVNGESRPTEGHAHLYINDESMQRIYSTWTHLPTLPEGTNEIRVTLNANGHETLTTQGTPIEDSVTVEVYDPEASK